MTIELDWEKMQGLIPAIVQDINTKAVLMLGYMNEVSLQQTLATGWVTFYSRSKKSLWMKGETSGNKLKYVKMIPDCDEDSLLILVTPEGPVCHTGDKTCFNQPDNHDVPVTQVLESLIQSRQKENPENSYTAKLLSEGINRIAQKVGEEGVEVTLAAIVENDETFCGEIADLFFHLLILLRVRNLQWNDVLHVLQRRMQSG
jgi:phosphoribosyl-ATP pyrophosphohydrolase/phosphoribosyl-AMP cyclohydrolase